MRGAEKSRGEERRVETGEITISHKKLVLPKLRKTLSPVCWGRLLKYWRRWQGHLLLGKDTP